MKSENLKPKDSKSGSLLKSSGLKDQAEKQRHLEHRIIRDLIVSTFAVIAFAGLVYFLNLLEMLAIAFKRPELGEVDTLILVIIYAIWMAGIFVLRRLYELREVAAERSQLVEQLHSAHRTEAVERMASGLAHDFNNVLTIISGQAELCLMEDKIDSMSRESFVRIKQATQNASELIKHLMTLGSSKAKVSSELNLTETILKMAPLLQSLVGGKIELKTVLDRGIGNIKAENSHINQILINLTKNAMDAMSSMNPGCGTISIVTASIQVNDNDASRRPNLKPGDYVMLSVVDNGHGIAPDIIPHIFDPFFTTKHEGTGLGLAMVSNLVKKNNGNIDVQSEPGKGAIFSVFFPATKKTTKVIEFAGNEFSAESLVEAPL